ncbi:acyl-CoA dehydrogenase [Dermatobacter hominis]|uniref:acyl-CoA dehydrogenase n=1 Tax=Dermatobacter hominis TaxID=2884263 RepID=UPI001D1252FE|nr:acyl-CoA dehydrogenase [Dermatobacter hominis]UDY35046.1 acyl-CoA dehydrogenase [Dermatobacter hominis]
MGIAIDEDHQLLADAVRRFASDRCDPATVRASLDAGGAAPPSFWASLADLGWVGLAVPEPCGGGGAGHGATAVVVEELGRAVAPGPLLPTAWAAGVLVAAATSPDGAAAGDALAGLAAGTTIGTVAPQADVDLDDGRASGWAAPVLCGELADLLVLPVRTADGPRWALVGRDGLTAAPVEALDATRPLARIELVGAPATLLPGVDAAVVRAVGVALAAAEAAGIASWCVDTAAAYAAVRRQFGRPIGQFQAVKHRCADMLVALEQIRALAWDAAVALDGEDPRGPEAGVAIAAAGAVALDAAVDIAKDCIQVLGGIGFTWEHDAHLYLRRALALRQLLGGAPADRRRLAGSALDGVRRRLQLELPPEADALRSELRATIGVIADLDRDERRVPLAEAGLIVPHWSPPWGRDATAVEQLVIDEELRRARVRVPHLQVGAWAAPTIATHGTEEQQERWVGPTLRGEISWCQLFSEPEAGSDLAALTTRADRVEGGWVLNGQKVWTTMAREADWGICLARTDRTAPKHLGITYFVVDMSSAGLDIRPLRELTGLEMFNEVFLTDVFVPDDCVVGEVDGGWALARTTLANERVSMAGGSSFGGGIEALVSLVSDLAAEGGTGGSIADDPLVLDELGALLAESHSIAVMGLRSTLRSLHGAPPGAEASVRKLLGVEHDQRTQELGLRLLGPEGATTVGPAAQWTFGFLANRCLTIAGGTSEIQRNVIGERLLGLPRDPEPSDPERSGVG